VITATFSLATEELAGADQRRRPLGLLERQEPQRVPHEHRHAILAGSPFDGPLQSANRQSERGEPEISLRLSTTGRKPEEVGNRIRVLAAVSVIEAADAGEVEQDERQLERISRPVGGDVYVVVVDVLASAHARGEERPGALEPYRVVQEPEGIEDLGIGLQERQPILDPPERPFAPLDRLPRHGMVMSQAFGGIVDLRLLSHNPIFVRRDQGLRCGAYLLLLEVGEGLHVEDEPHQLGEGVSERRPRWSAGCWG
jgi:hypothetical protein